MNAELIGKVFDDRFQVRKLLGSGGMGSVFFGTQLSIDRDVAIKVLHRGLPENARSRFLREARTMSGLSHPGIVQMIEFGEEDDLCFLVLELVDGIPVSDLINDVRLHPGLALTIAEQVTSALAEAHAHGVIHRDLKPGNILFTTNAGGEPQAKLLDFGIAYSESDPRLTQSGTLCGTPAYMAPEQAQAREVTMQTDYYALGVNLFEMLSGRLPFYADSPLGILLKHLQTKPPTLRAHVEAGVLPRAAVELTERLLKKEKQNRPESAKELRELIGQAKLDIGFTSLVLEGDLATAVKPYQLPPLTENPHADAAATQINFLNLHQVSTRERDMLSLTPRDVTADTLPAGDVRAVNDDDVLSAAPPSHSRDNAAERAWAAFSEAADSSPEPRNPANIDPNLWAVGDNDGMASFSDNSIEISVSADLFVIEPHDNTRDRPRLDFKNGTPASEPAAGKVSRDEKRPDWLESPSESMEYQLERAERLAQTPPPEPEELPELPPEQTGTATFMENIGFILLTILLVAGMAFIGMELFVKPAPKTPDEPTENFDYSGVLKEDRDDGEDVDRHPPTEIQRADDPDRRIRTPDEGASKDEVRRRETKRKLREKVDEDVIDLWEGEEMKKSMREIQDL